ncbi:MAG: serpin family protein [Candidatus Omnitrophica bacterium]|nr:serpin family protein [Candidatus Omnitrophota bacterium]
MKTKFSIIPIIMMVISLVSFLAFANIKEDLQIVVNGNSGFGFDLYQELKEKKGNLFFSPYSISTALAMTYAGARGQTEKEMAKVLHFSLEQEPLHSSFSKLHSELTGIQDKGHIKLSIANSLWAQEGYSFLDAFFNLNKKHYGAGLNFVDFATKTEAARKTINIWVENKTQQKIKELIKKNPPMITPDTALVLCNAIYFKGNWLSQFDKKRTVDTDFYISPDKAVKVPMMSQKAKFKFKNFDGFSTIELPYEGNDLSMIVFLPEKVDGLAEFERTLTNDNVKNWIDKLSNSYESEILARLPKFNTTCEFELQDVLAEMGMPHAFKGADFSGMTGKKDLFISKVIHKAFVDVNEEGTEAAAATAVVMAKSISKTLLFQADHPFVFLIRENTTGSILFIGRIMDPTK